MRHITAMKARGVHVVVGMTVPALTEETTCTSQNKTCSIKLPSRFLKAVLCLFLVWGEHKKQRGSNINERRSRVSFSSKDIFALIF